MDPCKLARPQNVTRITEELSGSASKRTTGYGRTKTIYNSVSDLASVPGVMDNSWVQRDL